MVQGRQESLLFPKCTLFSKKRCSAIFPVDFALHAAVGRKTYSTRKDRPDPAGLHLLPTGARGLRRPPPSGARDEFPFRRHPLLPPCRLIVPPPRVCGVAFVCRLTPTTCAPPDIESSPYIGKHSGNGQLCALGHLKLTNPQTEAPHTYVFHQKHKNQPPLGSADKKNKPSVQSHVCRKLWQTPNSKFQSFKQFSKDKSTPVKDCFSGFSAHPPKHRFDNIFQQNFFC